MLRFRGVYVFGVSQTDGQPLPEPAGINGDPGLHLDRIRTVVASRGIALDYEIGHGSALGLSRGGRISIRPGLPAAEEFAVIAYERAHGLLHRGEDRPASRTVRETKAEADAFVVAQAVGLDAIAAARGSHPTGLTATNPKPVRSIRTGRPKTSKRRAAILQRCPIVGPPRDIGWRQDANRQFRGRLAAHF